MIKVLVVEDSTVVRELLVHLLGSDPKIQVVGTAKDGEEAVEVSRQKKPDVITMDINMPKMNGFKATRRIMETVPTPIVIVSGSLDTDDVATTFRVLEAGALTIVPRPAGLGHPDHERSAKELVQTVKLMSEVKVVKRWARARQGQQAGESGAMIAPSVPPAGVREALGDVHVVAMGASTGGPVTVHTILRLLPKDFPLPILLVQHMSPGFVDGFAKWLTQSSAVPVQIALNGELPIPGHAYVAPDGFQMGLTDDGRIALRQASAEDGFCPSVSHLFQSVAAVFGRKAIAVLLSGMGRDGAAEVKVLKEQGAVTIAQDKASSAVYGMPGEAVRLGAATYVLPPEKIAATLATLAHGRGNQIGRRESEASSY